MFNNNYGKSKSGILPLFSGIWLWGTMIFVFLILLPVFKQSMIDKVDCVDVKTHKQHEKQKTKVLCNIIYDIQNSDFP